MADARVTDQSAIPVIAGGDKFHIVDVSDTTDNAAGSSKYGTPTQMAAFVSATANTFSEVQNFTEKAILVDTSASADAIDKGFNIERTLALGATQVSASVYGYFTNSGTNGTGGGHGIGSFGRATDTTGGKLSLYGVEGRADGLSNTSGVFYIGALGLGRFTGASYTNGFAIGTEGRVEITTDGTTPLAEGIGVCFYAPAITGGLTQYSLLAIDALRVDNEIQAVSASTATKIMKIYHNDTVGYIDSTEDLYVQPGVANNTVLTRGHLYPTGNFTQTLGLDGNSWASIFTGNLVAAGGSVSMANLPAAVDQATAGASAGELWVDTSAGNVIKLGV